MISGGVVGRHQYRENVFAVLTTDDEDKVKKIEQSIQEFDDDLKSMLNVSGHYLYVVWKCRHV